MIDPVIFAKELEKLGKEIGISGVALEILCIKIENKEYLEASLLVFERSSKISLEDSIAFVRTIALYLEEQKLTEKTMDTQFEKEILNTSSLEEIKRKLGSYTFLTVCSCLKKKRRTEAAIRLSKDLKLGNISFCLPILDHIEKLLEEDEKLKGDETTISFLE